VATEKDLARFDVALSATLMRYISDLHIGRINPRNIQFDLDVEHKKYYLPKLLAEIAAAADVREILETVEPPYADYLRLREALARYAAVAADGDQPPLPEVPRVRKGESYTGLPQLAKFLQRVGDLPSDYKLNGRTRVYDGAVFEAVRKFQRRHGLSDDGEIGPRTFKQLNVPVSKRLQQIQWALERWRWVPAEFERPPVIVNIPEFRLRGWNERQETDIEMNVVVGKAFQHETPVFQADIRHVVFRPYWNVPPSIQRAEIAPKLEKDPGYLRRNRYEAVVDYNAVSGTDEVTAENLPLLKSCRLLLRQKPGGDNALGLVKVVFPNRNGIYLHDTPSQLLFSRSRRDFSHGCIRLESPAALAAWLLRDQKRWSTEAVDKAMKQGDDNQAVALTRSIPILIVYTTVVVTEDGEVRFFDDIYGHDAKLENALAAGYPYPA
jgi:murein L,D-transpeptidase YcbB/YkuD